MPTTPDQTVVERLRTRWGRTTLVLLVMGLAVLLISAAIASSKSRERGSLIYDPNLISDLNSAAMTSPDAVALPRVMASHTWERALVVCPYATAEQAPPQFRDTVADLSLECDTAQWVLLSDSTHVWRIEVPRNAVDFCSGGSGVHEISPQDTLRAEWHEGVLLLRHSR